MIVGRDRELGELLDALDRAVGVAGGLCLLAGEPGIGKTRLAAEVAAAARSRGVRSTWGRCWEAGGAPALWPWREAFDGIGVGFPDAAGVAAADPEQARFAMFRAAAAALARAAATEPLLVILEDLHAADRSTLLLLELVAGQLRGQPVLVIGTYRELEASLRAESADAIARLGRSARVYALPRLRDVDVARIVRESIDDADDRLVTTVFEATGGNPLFVAEIVRDVRAYGRGDELPIPLGVREVIRQRLGLVAPEARRALEAGAVLGVEFGGPQVARIVEGAAASLEGAARSGLVSARGDRFRFAHALYREALYHDLSRERRQALHRDAARAVAATGATDAEVAHHLLEAGPEAGAEAVAQAVTAAAQAVDVFAFEDAAMLLERARLAVPPGALEEPLRARVLIAIGEARIRSGDPAGRALCVEGAQVARARGDAELLARAGLAYGAVFMTGGVDPVLVSMLEDALAALPEEDSPLRARVMARLAAARQPSAERARDIELSLEAVMMARRLGEPRALLAVLHSACGALYGSADPRVRLPIARELEKVAEQLGDVSKLLAARVRLALDYQEMGDFHSYDLLSAAYEEVATRIGRDAAPWRVPLMRSMIALAGDRFDESERWQAESRRLESERPQARRAQAFHRLGFLRAAERHAALRESIPELRALWMQMSYGGMLADARVASAFAWLGAEDEVRAVLARLPAAAWDEEINAASLAEAVWLVGAPGDPRITALRSVLDRYDERWIIYWLDVEIVEAPVTRLRAYLAALEGEREAAERLFADALRTLEVTGKRAMIARACFELGDLLTRLGHDPARARSLIEQGRRDAAALGLHDLVALVERRHPDLAATRPAPVGAAPPSASAAAVGPSGPGIVSLTAEGEYYALVAAGTIHRFKATRGMQYLARLLACPGVEVHVLDLAGAADAPDRGDAGELIDGAAFRAYRARLEALRDELEDAISVGAADRADRTRAEMEAIAAELARGTASGGRSRRSTSAVERARTAVQRRIKDAIDRVAERDPALGRRLRRDVTTGNYCCYRPVP